MYSGVPIRPVVVPAAVGDHPRDAEVGEPHRPGVEVLPLPGQQHVVGLEVPVEDALAVGGGEPVEHRGHHGDGAVGRQRSAVGEHVAQRPAVDEVHDDREPVALDDQVADGDDVGVAQAGQDRALTDEPTDQVLVGGVLLAQQLGRDHLVGPTVDGLPDLARGATAQPLDEPVGRSQGLVEAFGVHASCLPDPTFRRRRPVSVTRRGSKPDGSAHDNRIRTAPVAGRAD